MQNTLIHSALMTLDAIIDTADMLDITIDSAEVHEGTYEPAQVVAWVLGAGSLAILAHALVNPEAAEFSGDPCPRLLDPAYGLLDVDLISCDGLTVRLSSGASA